MPETFVLGYDGSPSANAALAETIRVVPRLGADVVVVFGYHASVLGGPLTGGESADFRMKLQEVGNHALARAVSDLEAAGIPVSSRLVEAKPADAILSVALEVGASRIVVGTVGENPVTGALLGSVVLKLVQRSSIPLLVRPYDRGVTMAADLQQLARDHLWMHFTRMGGFGAGQDVPIIVRGDGCYLEDSNGKRYLDALAGLFSVNIGYGYGEEIGQAALEQMRELPFYTNWSYAHPKAIELAAELASLAPGDLNRVFFVSGGSEAVEAAWKLARQYYVAHGEKRVRHALGEPETRHDQLVAARRGPHKYKAVARHIAYHGTTMGALSINGIPALRESFEPLVPEVRHVRNTNRYHRPSDETEAEFTQFLLDDLEQTLLAMGPETVCLVHMEPVQNAGGCFLPPAGYWQGVRAICDEYDVLLSADEVITGFGRLGHWFGSERYDIRPDIVTCAKGLSSSYGPIGAVIARDAVMEPFLDATSMYAHGITFGGHPVMCAIALKNIEIMKRDRIVEHVDEMQDVFRGKLETLLDLPIVGDVRGTGFFYAVELVKDKETRATFDDDECESLLRGFLSPALFEAGLICRQDDRGDPVIQISPPLVAGETEMDEIVGILGDVLATASERMQVHR